MEQRGLVRHRGDIPDTRSSRRGRPPTTAPDRRDPARGVAHLGEEAVDLAVPSRLEFGGERINPSHCVAKVPAQIVYEVWVPCGRRILVNVAQHQLQPAAPHHPDELLLGERAEITALDADDLIIGPDHVVSKPSLDHRTNVVNSVDDRKRATLLACLVTVHPSEKRDAQDPQVGGFAGLKVFGAVVGIFGEPKVGAGGCLWSAVDGDGSKQRAVHHIAVLRRLA
mmetsp:Transcript_6581/g.19503  ORF Transcript_6581/g.19503 Transcript_6581/m.19503 type:complete len:225 (-) Transcript_6581:906-1580(-)